jgi:TM2 domain-containing membrane protein YozV
MEEQGTSSTQNTTYVYICPRCGMHVTGVANFCPKCSLPLNAYSAYYSQPYYQKQINPNASTCSRTAVLLFCIFLGNLGIHRFYVGKVGTGILWLFTLGCLGIGTLVDFIMILTGDFTDQYGKRVTNWQGN